MKIYLAICAMLLSLICFASQNSLDVGEQKQQTKISNRHYLVDTNKKNIVLESWEEDEQVQKANKEMQKAQEEEEKWQLLQQEEAKQRLLEEQKHEAELRRIEHEQRLNEQKLQAKMREMDRKKENKEIILEFIASILGGCSILALFIAAAVVEVGDNQQSSNKYDHNDPNNSNRTSTSSSHDYDDDSSRWSHDSPSGINPASGLPLRTSSLDVAGNVLGSSIFSSSSSSSSHSSSSSYDPSRGY